MVRNDLEGSRTNVEFLTYPQQHCCTLEDVHITLAPMRASTSGQSHVLNIDTAVGEDRSNTAECRFVFRQQD